MQNAGGSYEVTTVIASGASDVTFSRDGTRIYAALRNGNIQVIDAATKAVVATWDIGNALRAISLSEDGTYLLVTEGQNPQGVSTVYRVDTATGAATAYTSPGGGFWDVEIVDADTAILTGGQQQVAKFNPQTGTFGTLSGAVYYSNSRGVLVEDDRLTLLAEPGISNGPLFIYSDTADAVVAQGDNYQSINTSNTTGFNFGMQAISEEAGLVLQFVNRNTINVFDTQLKFLYPLRIPGEFVDGIAFDESGTHAYFYMIDRGVVAKYAVAGWALVEEFVVGTSQWHNDIGFGSQILFSDDGRYMTVMDTNASRGRVQIIDLSSRMAGTGGPDTLSGGDEDNVIRGGDGNDTLSGNGGRDTLYGEGGDDILFGGGDVDALNGGDGNDYLDGGAGADAMGGFAGNDLYIVDDAGDTAVEAAGEGTDEIRTALASLSLAGYANVENLTGTSAGAQTLTGNELDNVITGSIGGDTLAGAGGNDTLIGMGGADLLQGGFGDDIYVIDGADTISEAGGGGTDEVRTGQAVYVLPADFENLRATSDTPHDFRGNAGDNVVTGGAGNDIFRLQDGGNDSAFGLGGRDVFYFGAAFDAQDRVDGGGNNDILVLQGNYGAGTTLGTGGVSNVTGIGSISLFSSQNTLYGGQSAGPNAYNLTLLDGAVAAGQVLRINAFGLASNEHTRIDGSAETDGQLWFYGGLGIDNFIGGAGDDLFIFGVDGRFGDNDRVAGGAGNDTIVLRGDYSVTFPGGPGSITGIETIRLLSATDTSLTSGGDGEFDYFVNVPAYLLPQGTTITIDARGLQANESVSAGATLALADALGNIRIFSGAANDSLRGARGDDLLFGGLGADQLTGNQGADTFRYETTQDSTTASFDRIFGFTGGTDKFDLSAIDANVFADGDQAFRYIDRGDFSGQGAASAGELRLVAEDPFGNWFVEGDTNGDGVADLYIRIQDGANLSGADFVL